MQFLKRTTKPNANDKNWIHYKQGGLNKCILIKGNSCLPNCVGYCWGRWYELLKTEPKLARTNAETWYINTSDGYLRGKEPKLGAVACWSQGSTSTGNDGCGHVAIVEEIYDDGSILISESNYGYSNELAWRTKKISKGYKYVGNFQGFIYLPIEFDKNTIKAFNIGKVYTLKYTLSVRQGPGTNYQKKTKQQLTKDGQKYANVKGALLSGTKVTCLEIKEDIYKNIWIRIPSGWIASYYNNEYYII